MSPGSGARPAVLVRPATDDDLPSIARLHTASWRSAYVGMLSDEYLAEVDRRHGRQWLMMPAGSITLVAVENGIVVGFACVVGGEPGLGDRLLDNLHVHPTARCAGVGGVLLARVRALAAAACPGGRLYLWVFEANERGRRFYRREGGVEAETRVEVLAPATVVLERRIWWQLP